MKVDRDFISIFVLFICGYCTPVSVSISARNDFEKKYGKVVHVSAIFRHGDRTPWMLYPRDPYQIYSWPDGLQQLTKKGKQRLYNLGKWFRKRYKKFFDPYISHTNIRIDSSDTDRTIMSAQCFLAGFYPPTKKDRLDKKLLWQPLPVHSIPRKYDNIILHSQECNKYNYYLKKVYNSSKMKKIYDRNKKTIDYLEKYTGFHFSKNQLLNVAYNLYVVYDSLLVESENNLKLPTWSKKVYPEPLKNLINLFDGVEFSLHIAKKLIAGPLLKSIIDDMVNKVKNNSTQKFHFYSGHDWSIFTIMKSLLVHKDHFPPYGASILFELREKTNKYFVTVFYKNSTNTSPHLLQIRHCKPPCKLKNFLRITRNLIPLDWESECQLKDNVTVELRETRMVFNLQLFRHGNRTPIQTYPTDPYQNYSWPNGLGQLTKTGEQAEYELGKWFNKRYEFFIRSNLTYRHLKMDSSDIDRTIMSAQLFLAGFFPPRKLEKINIKLLWRPIPVHTIASEIDNLISFRRNCSSYEYYHENYLNTSVKMKKTYKNYEKEIQYVEKYSGLKFSTKQAGVIINELNLYVTDTLIVQNENKLILPSWTKKVFPVPLIKIKDQTFQIAVNEFKIKRLQAGPLLKSIAADMNMKTKTSFPQVFHFYSGHDITIITIMITLGIYNYITPPYAASLIFELRKKENENIVTVLYKNSTTTKPYLMEIPKCGSICKLQTFLTILKSYIPTNWDAECRSK